jgi:integrase
MMAADKIRPAAVKIGIRLEPSERFGFHNLRHSLAIRSDAERGTIGIGGNSDVRELLAAIA